VIAVRINSSSTCAAVTASMRARTLVTVSTTIATCSALIIPCSWAAATAGNSGANDSPVVPVRGPNRVAAARRRCASAVLIRNRSASTSFQFSAPSSRGCATCCSAARSRCDSAGSWQPSASYSPSSANSSSRPNRLRSAAANRSNAARSPAAATTASHSAAVCMIRTYIRPPTGNRDLGPHTWIRLVISREDSVMAFKLTYTDGAEADYDDDTAWEVDDGVLKIGRTEGDWTVLVSPSHWAVIEVGSAKKTESKDESDDDSDADDDSEADAKTPDDEDD
jgi:hypothetical protein